MSSRIDALSSRLQARRRNATSLDTPWGCAAPACMVVIILLVLATSIQARSDSHLRHVITAGLPNVGGPGLENEVTPEVEKDGNLRVILSQLANQDATELRPHTVDEKAAVLAARKAMARARQAERQTLVLSRKMQQSVVRIEKKVKEIKNNMSIAQRVAQVEKAAAAAGAAAARIARAKAAEGLLPAIALPPGAASAEGPRRRGRRGRTNLVRQMREPRSSSAWHQVSDSVERELLMPVLPPGGSRKPKKLAYTRLAAGTSEPRTNKGLPVLEVGEEGRWMIVASEDAAGLPPAPDMLIISLSDGGEQVLPYSANSRVPPADADAASSNARGTLKISLKVVAAAGARFPLSAAYVRPALQARYLVRWISESQQELHADGYSRDVQGAGFVRAQLASGEVLTLPFSRSQLVAGVAGGEGAAGLPQQRMALYAAAGCAFPRNVAYVSAMAGSPWASPYHQGVISAAAASYFTGLSAQVLSLSVDGRRLQVQAEGLAEMLESSGRIVIREQHTCALVSAYFSASQLHRAGAGAKAANGVGATGSGKAQLLAARPSRFPDSAKQVIIPSDPVVSFSVYWRAHDGSRLRVQAPDNGALHRRGGTVVVTRINGEQALYRITSAQPHAADGDGPEGIMLVAAMGVRFPADVVRVSQGGPVSVEGKAPLNIEYVDAQGGYAYRVGNALGVGEQVYVDRDLVYTSVPEELVGHKYVMSAMGDAGSDARHQFVTLFVDRPADIYVLYDAAAREPPQWLSDACFPVGGAVQTTRGSMSIWKTKMIVTGAVAFGGNAAFPAVGGRVMYTVVVLPAASHRARPPSARIAASATSSMQYPVVLVSDRGDSLTILSRATGAFPAASEDSPQSMQIQKRDGSIVEAVYVEIQVIEKDDKKSPPQLRFRASPVLSFPAEATGASPAAVYQVVFQSPDGSVMRVDSPNDGRFSPGPGRVKIKMAYGHQADFPYASLRATAGGMELRAPEGLAFPADAVAAAPAARPLADPVVMVSSDYASMRLLVADTAVYFPGPSTLRVMTRGGLEVQRIKYSAVQYVAADVNGPAGLQFSAAEGAEFPKDALCAEALSFPVLSVNPDGSQMEVLVPSSTSFPPGPCQVKLKSIDGDDVSIPYATSALLATKTNGKIRLLLVAKKKPFPRMPSFAEPDCEPIPYQAHKMRPVLFPILTNSKATLPGITTSSVKIQARSSDGFVMTGGYVKVYCSGGDVIQVPYKYAHEDSGVLTLTLPRGAAFPGDAVQVAPESAPVMYMSSDKKLIQIAAPNDGSFLPGPGVVYGRLPDGKEVRLRYDMVGLLHPGGAAGGIIVTSAKGFPANILAVRPSPDETASRPRPSRAVSVGKGGHTIALKPSSSFPARGVADVSLPDGRRVKVDYVSSHMSASEFSVALPDGTTVNVPASYVKEIPPHAKVTLPDGSLHTVGLSAVEPKVRNLATTEVLVTLPNGQEIKVPEISIIKDKNQKTMLRVMLRDGQRVEVPENDVLPVLRTYMVKLAGSSPIEVPEARVRPCSCDETLNKCKCSLEMESAHEGGRADKYQVHLPDGTKVKVLPDDITVGKSSAGNMLKVTLPGGQHATVPASEVKRDIEGIPHGMVQVRLAGGAVQIVSETSLAAQRPEPEQYQVLLPEGLYTLVDAKSVSKAPGMVTIKLADGDDVNVPDSNVHKPAPELSVALSGGRSVDVLPSDVTVTEAHLEVLLPDGKTVKMATSRVSKAKVVDGATRQLILEAADGAAFPTDAQYVTPIHVVPLEVTQTSEDARRLVVVAPPDSLPDVYSRVRIIQANGRTSEVNYESARVLSGQAVGPFVPVNRIAEDGSWIEVPAPTALPPAPGMLRAALRNGKQVDVMFAAMQAQGADGTLRLVSSPGSPFPDDILQVASEGPRKVLLTARQGEEWPPKAVGLVPVRDVQTSFPVVGVIDGVRMRVDARDDGTFPQGPGILRARVHGGTQMLLAYDSVAVCVPDLVGPGGLIFTSPNGLPFPNNVEMVQTTTGFGHSDGTGGANEELLVEVVSDAESQEALGPPCAVTGESKDGSQMQVAPYGLFSDFGGLIDVKIADGPVVRVQYVGVNREQASGYVTMQTLIAARGSRFPSAAEWVQPVGQQKLRLGTLETGSELYSDDSAHQFTSVPAELHGSKLILTDNAARGSTQSSQLSFNVWGWSSLYVLRPDAKCDMTKQPVVCSYQTSDVPRWLLKHFKPRPDLFVTTTDGSMAVYESLHPLQGPVSLGGNGDVPPERLMLSSVIARSARIYEVVNASSTTSLYVDRLVTITQLPEELQDEPMIQSASVDKDSTDPHFLTVVLSIASDCYILRDNSAGDLPLWLSQGFQVLQGLKVETSEGTRSVMQSRLPLFGQTLFGGNGGGASMYTVICVATKYAENTAFPEPRVAVSQIKVQPDLFQGELGSEMAALQEQQPIQQLHAGQQVYVDNLDIRVLKVPAQLQGATLVRTARRDKGRRDGDVMSFYVSQPSDIYIVRDDSPTHSWLPVAGVAYPGDASGLPSPVVFVSADGTKIRVMANTPFPPGPAAVLVRDRQGHAVEVEYEEASDAASAWLDSAVLVPGGLEIVAKHGSVFPADSATVIPASAVGSDVTEMAVMGGASDFSPGAGLAVVRTRDGKEATVRYASSELVDAPSGNSERIILKAPKGERFPVNVDAVRAINGGRDALPQWLAAGFVLTEMVVQTSRGAMHVYKSRLPVDDRVVLGGNAELPAEGSLWGNYAVALLPAGSDPSRGAGSLLGGGSFPLDNYVVAVRQLGQADESAASPASVAVGAASAFLTTQREPQETGIPPEPTLDSSEAATWPSIPAQYAVVGLDKQGTRLLVQVQGVDGSFPEASHGAPQRLDVMQATGAVAEFPYVSVGVDKERPEAGGGERLPVLAFSALEGFRFPPDAVAASPAARFLVVECRGKTMIVASSGAGIVGAAAVKVRTKGGVEMQIPIMSSRMKGGLLVLEARAPAVFPDDSALVGPAATPPPVSVWTSFQRRFPVYDTSQKNRNQLVVQVNAESDLVPGPETVLIEIQNGEKVSAKYETAAILPRPAAGIILVQLTAPLGSTFPAFAQYVEPQRSASDANVAPLDKEVSEYVVIQAEQTTMVVRAAEGTFPAAPGRVRVKSRDQAPMMVLYSSMRPYRDGEGPSEIVFAAALGHAFPAGASSVTPEFEPIISIRHDGFQMQVKAPDDGLFPPGPALLRLKLGDGSIMSTKYASAARLFSASAAGGVLLTAEPKSTFPLDAVAAAPQDPREFQVCEAAAGGTEIRVTASNDGSFQPAPASMALLLSGLGQVRQKVVQYESLTAVPASDGCPEGLLLRGNFGRELMPAVVAVAPMRRHDNQYGSLLHDVECQGLGLCKTGRLAVGSALHADDLGAQARQLPARLEGLEYIRTPASPKGLHGPGVVKMTLPHAADVFILVPEIQDSDARVGRVDAWFPVLRVSKDSTKLIAVVPNDVDIPGSVFPAAPWVIKIKTSDGGSSTCRYVSVRRLSNDDAGEAVAVRDETGQLEKTMLHDLKAGTLVEFSSEDWGGVYHAGGVFPDGSFRIAAVPGFEPPEWIPRQFYLTSLTVHTTLGAMLVWKSKEPMSGRISFEGLLDAPAPRQVTVEKVESKGVAGYRLASLVPGVELYVDNQAVVTEVPAALSGMSLIQTAIADAENRDSAFLKFAVDEPSLVYVLASGWGGAEPPWISSGFERTQWSCITSIGRLSVWRSVVPLAGDVELGGNFAAAAMYVVVVVPLARSDLPMTENYVVAVRGEPAFDPIGMQSAFADASAPVSKSTKYPQAKDLAVFPVSYVDGTSMIVQCDADAPFPPAPGRMEIVLRSGKTVDVAYTSKEVAQRQRYVVLSGGAEPVGLGTSRSELVVVPPADVVSGRVGLPRGGGTVTVELADGSYRSVRYAEFEEIPTLNPSDEQQVLVVAAPGYTFPAAALAVFPAESGLQFTGPEGQKFPSDAVLASPSPQFQISGLSPDGTEMRVSVPDDGTFEQGPSELSVMRSDGTRLSLPYSNLFPVAATETEPSGIIFVSRPGETFPSDGLLAGPAAGPALRITDIKVQLAPTATAPPVPAEGYRIGTMGVGKGVYADSSSTFVDLPDALLGSVYIQTLTTDATRDADKFLSFKVNQPAFVAILVESPKKKVSWVPYWFPEFLGGVGGTEQLPLWVTKDFKHAGLEVLSTDTRYEVFMSKKRYVGEVVLGGNEAAPSVGSRKMYDVVVCRRNVTALGGGRLVYPSLSDEWTGGSNDLGVQSWYPVSAVKRDTLTVLALPGSFKLGGGEVHVYGADGSGAVMQYVEARRVEGSPAPNSWFSWELKMAEGASVSAAYVRPTESLPQSEWPVRSVSPDGDKIILDAPESAFPEAPARLSLIVRGRKGRVHIAYDEVKSIAGGTASQISATRGERFPATATFAGVSDPDADGPPEVTNIKVTPQGAMAPATEALNGGPPARRSMLQYDVSTVGAGKRVWVDRSEIMTKVPASLAGEEFIMTADEDKDLNQPGRSPVMAHHHFCALSFYVSRPGLVLVAITQKYKQMPKWLSRDFVPWNDPDTGSQGFIETNDGSKLFVFRDVSNSKAQDQLKTTSGNRAGARKVPKLAYGDVCLGGRKAFPSISPKHNYIVIVARDKREAVNGPLAWDGTPLSVKMRHSPGKWFRITSRSEDGDTIRVEAKALQDGFSAPLQPQDQSPSSEDGSAGSDAMDDVLKHALDTADEVAKGLVMIKACDSAEAPYTILSMRPVPADDNQGAGIELTVGPGLSFPPCVSYARPYYVSVDGTPGEAIVPPKTGSRDHGRLEFTSTSWHVSIGEWSVHLSVVRRGGSTGPVSVRYTTADGTAHKNMDYKESSGWLIWKDGEDGAKKIEVPLAAHAPSPQGSGEWVRFFTVMLSDPTGGVSIGHPGIVSVQLDSHGAVTASRLQPNSADTSLAPADEYQLETTSAEAWRYPVSQVTDGGKFIKVVASLHAPFALRGAMTLECSDGRKGKLTYESVAPAASVEMQVVGVSAEGYVMVVDAKEASIPRGPGLLNLRDKGGNLAEVVYTSAAQSEGSHVVVRAPAGFPFPKEALYAWIDSMLLLQAPGYQPFPTFLTQSPVADCSVTPSPLSTFSEGVFPVTYVSVDKSTIRVEAPADSPFPPRGRLDLMKPDGSRQTVEYGVVSVVDTATYRVISQAPSGASIVVQVIPEDGSKHDPHAPGPLVPAFPGGPAELILSIGAAHVLVNYAYAAPYAGSSTRVQVFAAANAPFPAGTISSVALTTTGLVFSHVSGLEGPAYSTGVDSIGGTGIDWAGGMAAYPVSEQLALPGDYNTNVDERDPADQRVKWFALVDMAADGSHIRLQAPPDAVTSGRGILRLQNPSGNVQDISYSSATVESALPFNVYAIAGNGSQCIVRAHPYAFPPGPGTLLVTRRSKPVIRIQYESATPMSVGSGLVRVTAGGSSTDVVFPPDATAVTPSVGLLRIEARVGDSFPASMESAASQPVAIGLARFLHTGVESDGFYVVGVSAGGTVLHVSAPMDAPFTPAGMVSVQDSSGVILRFPYDRVMEAPQVQFVVEEEEAKEADQGGRYFKVKTSGYALAPHGLLLAQVPGEESKTVAYEAVRPAGDKQDPEGWVEVTLVRGQSLPKKTLQVAPHPRGLLLEAPLRMRGDKDPRGVFPASLSVGNVAVSKAWPAGFGAVRFPVTLVEGDGSRSILRVEAPAAQHAWSKGNQWGVMLSLPDGSKEVWPYERALPVEEASFAVTGVASDGSEASVAVHHIAIPPAPCVYEVTTRMGFIRHVNVLATQYSKAGVVSLRATPGHLWPVDSVSASPRGALELISYRSLPFPDGLVRPEEAVADSWAEPTPAHLTKFPILGVSAGGLDMTVAVPRYVHAFIGQAAGRVDVEVGSEEEGKAGMLASNVPSSVPSVQQFVYAGAAHRDECSFEVAWVKEDGGTLALLPTARLAFPAGPTRVTVLDDEGTSTIVRVVQASLSRKLHDVTVIHLTPAPADAFPRAAKRVTVDCVTLSADPAHRFPLQAVSGPVSIHSARPPPSLSDRRIPERPSQQEAAKQAWEHAHANEADEAGAGAMPAYLSAFPFQYTVTHVAANGKALDVFVAEGLPEPELVSTFELACDIRRAQPHILWVASEERLSSEAARVPVHSYANDGADILLVLPPDTAFPQGPGLLQLELADGSARTAPYESVVPQASTTDKRVLVLAPRGLPFPSAPAPTTAMPLGETLRLFSAADSLIPPASTGCMARPVRSKRLIQESQSSFGADGLDSENIPAPPPPPVEQGTRHTVNPLVSSAASSEASKTWTRSKDPFLKPHPSVSALECASALQYTVGTLGEGKRVYVDDDATWQDLPRTLRGSPVIMTALADSKATGTFISLFVDEPADVYVFLPSPKATRRSSGRSRSASLSWLPFKLPSLLGEKKETLAQKDDIPSWMEGEFEVVEELSGALSSGEKFDVWRRKLPVLGFLQLGGNEGMSKGAKRGMYVAVLAPASAASTANMTYEKSLDLAFPGSENGVSGQGAAETDNGGGDTEQRATLPLESGVLRSLRRRGSGSAHQGRATGPQSLSRGAAGDRGRVRGRPAAASRAAASASSRRHARQAILKALVALRRRISGAASRKGSSSSRALVKTSVSGGSSASSQRFPAAATTARASKSKASQNSDASGAASTGSSDAIRQGAMSSMRKATISTQGLSAADLHEMVERCGSKDAAARCLVRAQACMSSRTVTDPANCRCFADAVESFSDKDAAERGLCGAACMSIVQTSYDRHVHLVTGKKSPCV